MKTKNEITRILKQHKNELIKEFNIKKIGLFGSCSRDEHHEGSDIDILVELDDPLGLRFVRLAYVLQELLNSKVDLVSKDAIKPRLWQYIERDIVYV